MSFRHRWIQKDTAVIERNALLIVLHLIINRSNQKQNFRPIRILDIGLHTISTQFKNHITPPVGNSAMLKDSFQVYTPHALASKEPQDPEASRQLAQALERSLASSEHSA